MKALADNDIVFKGACYRLLADLFAGIGNLGDPIGVLGAVRFVVSKRIRRTPINNGVEAALASLEDFLKRAVSIEPTEAERSMAAEFELAALRSAVSLDSGESQLCAVLIARAVPVLLTGDKRAIRAMEQLLTSDGRLDALCGKVKCLEQLILDAITDTNKASLLRERICSEPNIDKALTICFACRSHANTDQYLAGLHSYIADLRSMAGKILSV